MTATKTADAGERRRMCVACRRLQPLVRLLRVRRRESGGWSVAEDGYLPGRSAYVCRSEECIRQAIRGKRLARGLRCQPGAEQLAVLHLALLEAMAVGDDG
ncbi:MAG: YlxR family protein [Negativicutes bacterium]|nr:YlxR family protein [Negativicutes bacterium]